MKVARKLGNVTARRKLKNQFTAVTTDIPESSESATGKILSSLLKDDVD